MSDNFEQIIIGGKLKDLKTSFSEEELVVKLTEEDEEKLELVIIEL